MLLPIIMMLMAVGAMMVIIGLLIENLVMYPKIFNKLGKKRDKAQTLEQRDRYIEFYKKLCKKEGSSLFFYNILCGIDKYGMILVKFLFLIGFLQMGILLVTGLLNGQFQYVG